MQNKIVIKVQTPSEFFVDFINLAKRAKKRIWIQAMLFEAGRNTSILEKTLVVKLTKKEKPDVRVALDWVSSKAVHGKIGLFPEFKNNAYATNLHCKTWKILTRFKEKGINVFINNKPNLISVILPLFKRNHIKMYVVDNAAVWLGGVNFTDNSFTNTDFMVKFTGSKTVSKIASLYNIQNAKRNFKVTLSNGYIIYIDNGYCGRSIILDKELQIISKAKKEILFISQFIPDGKVLEKFIRAAKKGVKVTVYTSNIEHRAFQEMPYKLFYIFFKYRIRHIPNFHLIHAKQKIHAKYLEIDKEKILFGSHNLIQSTVLLGTKEIGVYAHDRQLSKSIRSNLNLSIEDASAKRKGSK